MKKNTSIFSFRYDIRVENYNFSKEVILNLFSGAVTLINPLTHLTRSVYPYRSVTRRRESTIQYTMHGSVNIYRLFKKCFECKNSIKTVFGFQKNK